MKGDINIKPIAHIRTDFPEKFGIPRQSGLVKELESLIVFEPEFRNPDALRDIEGFSYLWLIWEFSESVTKKWSPTVRPPRLGGNTRVGVFATRSPFRPNPLGLSSVKLLRVDKSQNDGDVLVVSGADMLDNTPIYDIKPYIPYADCHSDARGGFSDTFKDFSIDVDVPEDLLSIVPENKRKALIEVLAQDPRPSYQDDELRVYGMQFGGFNVKFKVAKKTLSVCKILRIGTES